MSFCRIKIFLFLLFSAFLYSFCGLYAQTGNAAVPYSGTIGGIEVTITDAALGDFAKDMVTLNFQIDHSGSLGRNHSAVTVTEYLYRLLRATETGGEGVVREIAIGPLGLDPLYSKGQFSAVEAGYAAVAAIALYDYESTGMENRITRITIAFGDLLKGENPANLQNYAIFRNIFAENMPASQMYLVAAWGSKFNEAFCDYLARVSFIYSAMDATEKSLDVSGEVFKGAHEPAQKLQNRLLAKVMTVELLERLKGENAGSLGEILLNPRSLEVSAMSGYYAWAQLNGVDISSEAWRSSPDNEAMNRRFADAAVEGANRFTEYFRERVDFALTMRSEMIFTLMGADPLAKLIGNREGKIIRDPKGAELLETARLKATKAIARASKK